MYIELELLAIVLQSTTSLHTGLHITAIRTCVWYMHCSIFNTKKIKWNLLSCNSVFLTHSTNAVIRVCKYGHILLSHFHGFDSTCIDFLHCSGCSSTKANTKVDVRHQQEKCKNSASCPCVANVLSLTAAALQQSTAAWISFIICKYKGLL